MPEVCRSRLENKAKPERGSGMEERSDRDEKPHSILVRGSPIRLFRHSAPR